MKEARYNKFQNDYPVKKEDGIGHVHKRMGSALRIYKNKCRGSKLPDRKTVGGRGRLNDAVVHKIQNYYGMAIRSNIGKPNDMQNTIWAIYFHMIMGPSNETLNEQHQYCPVTPNSWCKYQVDQINGTSFYNQQNCLPPVFCSELHFIFNRLSADSLLQGCQRGLTQNQNESLNNMVRACCPKRLLCGINSLQISVYEAVTTFNSEAYARKQVLDNIGLITSRNCVTAFENGNKKGIIDASRKILQKNKKRCQQLRSLQKKSIKSSTTYFPGAFSKSTEPDISINKEKRKVPIIKLRFMSEEQIVHLQLQSGKKF